MTGEFEGKVVLVTGGGGGCIGGPTALRFATEGANLILADMNARRCREWSERIRSETGVEVRDFVLDIGDRPAVDEMLAAGQADLGPVDVLVCNAAENKLGRFLSLDVADWDRTIDVSLSANFYLSRQVAPSMVERGGGNIVMLASVAAWMGDPNEDGEIAYACAKAGLVALTRNIAAELGPFGVRCNGIAPGLIWSRFVEKYQAQFDPLIARTPLRRYGRSDDIVEAVMFLASDRRSGFITGETISVSGGWYMRP